MKRVAASLSLLALAAVTWLGCSRKHDANSFLPSSPEFSGSLVLSVSVSSIPADGFSRLEITAQITGGADIDKRQVRFSTDNGDFPREAAAGTQVTVIDVNSNGSATVELRSSTSPTLATITGQVLKRNDDGSTETIAGLITRITVEFTPADAAKILELVASSLVGEADGASVIFIHADVAPEVPLNNPVTFVTTLGTFLNGSAPNTQTTTITPDIGRRATAALQSPTTAGEALVTATVIATTQEVRIVYDPALPEVIVVNLDPVKIERDGVETSSITLTLQRAEGTVSDGLEVEYSAFEREYGEPLDLLFSMQTLTMNEAATAQVSLGNVEFVGTATIRAEIGGVRGEADLEVVGTVPVPDIAVSPSSLDFGSVGVGHTSDLAIEVRNVGGEDLTVSALTVSGGDFAVPSPPPLPNVIPPGGKVAVTVRFSPAAAGAQSRTLTIDSDDPDESSLAVSLTGEGL